MQSTNRLFKNLFTFNWTLKPNIERYEKKENHKPSTKPTINIQDIPIHLLKQIISHTYVVTDVNHISSLRQVCRSWNITISHMIHDEITKYSSELILLMRCQTFNNEIVDLNLSLQQSFLNNKCRIEFFPQVNQKLEKHLFADNYKFIDFFLLCNNNNNNVDDEKECLRKKKEISRYSMKTCKFDNSSINSNSVIDLDLAFQYIPYEPMTFRVKAISFSPIYLLNLFNLFFTKKENDS
ncbi:hypothetical protein C1645_761451 [Glomus cerebriforme]|uniref:F-box domain-containing protein n=1 Tax=Glomus cerebriforme TaxID=658196 RepID=A0A397TBP9_9GLOM|nr:hypothetical protein C1645_761451 [Glomus cerebriforme]